MLQMVVYGLPLPLQHHYIQVS